MLKRYISVFLILLFFSCGNELEEHYDESGNLIAKGNLIDGKKEGKWVYFKEGLLDAEENYSSGNLDGKVILYSREGDISSEKSFKNGKKHGAHKSYFKDGSLRELFYYENGLQVGTWEVWFENGQQRIKGGYDQTDSLENAFEWFENGQLKYERLFVEDSNYIKTSEFDVKGNLLSIDFQPLNPNDTVSSKKWYSTGKLREVKTVFGSKKVEYKLFYPSGEIKEIRSIKADHLHGNLKGVYPSGKNKFQVDESNNSVVAKYYNSQGDLEMSLSNVSSTSRLDSLECKWMVNGNIETGVWNGSLLGLDSLMCIYHSMKGDTLLVWLSDNDYFKRLDYPVLPRMHVMGKMIKVGKDRVGRTVLKNLESLDTIKVRVEMPGMMGDIAVEKEIYH